MYTSCIIIQSFNFAFSASLHQSHVHIIVFSNFQRLTNPDLKMKKERSNISCLNGAFLFSQITICTWMILCVCIMLWLHMCTFCMVRFLIHTNTCVYLHVHCAHTNTQSFLYTDKFMFIETFILHSSTSTYIHFYAFTCTCIHVMCLLVVAHMGSVIYSHKQMHTHVFAHKNTQTYFHIEYIKHIHCILTCKCEYRYPQICIFIFFLLFHMFLYSYF